MDGNRSNPFDEVGDETPNAPSRPMSFPVDVPPPVPTLPTTMTSVPSINEEASWEKVWSRSSDKIFSVHQQLTMAISSPELVSSSMMTKHVIYVVKTDPLGYSVKRRFNDFAWLREALVHRYSGLFIPALPSTTRLRGATQRLTGEKTDIQGDFVKNRMAQLNMFAHQLCRIPFVRTDPAFIAFVSISNDKEWKNITDNPQNIEKHTSFENWKNDGLDIWFNILDEYIVNQVDSDRSIMEFRRQLDMIIKILELIEKEAKITGTKAVHFVLSSNQLQEQFLTWQKLENDLLGPGANEVVSPHGPRVKQLMTNLLLGQLQWTSNMAMIPQIIARVILSNIQYQAVQVDHFIGHMTIRDNMIKELERTEKERIKALEEKNRAAANGQNRRTSMTSLFSKTAENLDELCQRKTEAVNSLQKTVDRMTKAMMLCEIERFNTDRIKCINQLVGSLSVTNLEIAQASQKKWSDVVSNVGIDTSEFSEFVDMLQNTLDVNDMFAEAV